MTGIKLTGAAAPVITRLARLGFAAKGIVTILIGALALRSPWVWVAASQDLEKPYALWMFVEAILDPERKGSSFQGLAERVAFFVTGVGFVLMAYATVNLLLGTEANGRRAWMMWHMVF